MARLVTKKITNPKDCYDSRLEEELYFPERFISHAQSVRAIRRYHNSLHGPKTQKETNKLVRQAAKRHIQHCEESDDSVPKGGDI